MLPVQHRLPAAPARRPAQPRRGGGGPLRRVVRPARIEQPADQSHLAGWVAARFGERLYRHFFQSYNEKVRGVPGHGDPGRLGRAADQEPVPGRGGAHRVRPAARCHDHVADRAVPLSAARAGDDVGALPGAGRGRGLQGPSRPARHPDPPRGRARGAGRDHRGRRGDHVPLHARRVVDAAGRPAARDGPAGARRGPRGRGRAAVPRLPHRRPRGARRRRVPRQLDLRPLPGGPGGADPELRGVVAELVKPGHTCLGLEYFVFAGGDLWELPDAGAGRARDPRARGARPSWRRRACRPGTSCGCPRRTPSTTRASRRTSRCLRDWLAAHAPNVLPVGRNGMHRYDNQDHSMLTAMLAVETSSGSASTTSGRWPELRGRLPRRVGRCPGPGATPRSCPRSGTIPQPHEADHGHQPDGDDEQRRQRRDVEPGRPRGGLPGEDGQGVATERAQQGRRRQLLDHLDGDEQRRGRSRPAAGGRARRRAAAPGPRRARGRRRRGSAGSASSATPADSLRVEPHHVRADQPEHGPGEQQPDVDPEQLAGGGDQAAVDPHQRHVDRDGDDRARHRVADRGQPGRGRPEPRRGHPPAVDDRGGCRHGDGRRDGQHGAVVRPRLGGRRRVRPRPSPPTRRPAARRAARRSRPRAAGPGRPSPARPAARAAAGGRPRRRGATPGGSGRARAAPARRRASAAPEPTSTEASWSAAPLSNAPNHTR